MNESKLDNELSPKEWRFNIFLSFFDAAIVIFFIQIMNGPIFTQFWLKLGLNQTSIGFVTALLYAMQIFSPLISSLVSVFQNRRFIAGITGLIGRICIFLTVGVTIITPENPPLSLIIVIFTIGCFGLAIHNVSWSSLIVKVLPSKSYTLNLMQRGKIMTIIGAILAIISSIFLDKTNSTLQSIQVVILIATGGGILGTISILFYKEPKLSVEKISIIKAYMIPLRNVDFKRFLVYAFFINFVATMIIPIQNTYMFGFLQMNLSSTSAYYIIISLISFILGVKIGNYTSKPSNKAILYLSTFIIGLLMPLFLILAGPNNSWLVYLAAPCEALILGVMFPCIYCLPMKSIPNNQSVTYMAMFAAAMGLGGGLGAFLSGPLFNLLNQFKFTFIGIDWNGYRLMFLFVGVLRLLTLRLLKSINEPPNNLGAEIITNKQLVVMIATNFAHSFANSAVKLRQTAKHILATIFRRKKLDMDE